MSCVPIVQLEIHTYDMNASNTCNLPVVAEPWRALKQNLPLQLYLRNCYHEKKKTQNSDQIILNNFDQQLPSLTMFV